MPRHSPDPHPMGRLLLELGALLVTTAGGCGVDTPVSLQTSAAAGADLDGDGRADLVFLVRRRTPEDCTTDSEGFTSCTGGEVDLHGRVEVRLQDERGLFPRRRKHRVGRAPRAMVVEDLDGDGLLDIAVVNDDVYDTVSVLRQNPDEPGSFLRAETLQTRRNPRHLEVADLDGDRAADLIVAEKSLGRRVEVFPGDPSSATGFGAPFRPAQ